MKYISPNEISELLKNGRIIVYRKHYIYDITNLIKKHPGGSKCLLDRVNSQCQQDYEFHNKLAKNRWKNYLIGTTLVLRENPIRNLFYYLFNKL
jgi:cytochrome b involved in lipid metabolism